MMLYESEAKGLLAVAGIAVPASFDGGTPVDRFPVIVKAEVLEGGRGRRGGILPAGNAAELVQAVATLKRGSPSLSPTDRVLVEALVDVTAEIYVAIVADRRAAQPVLLVSARGGVDIEEQGAAVVRLPVPLSAETIADIASRGAAEARVPSPEAVASVIERLWRVFVERECELAEINPLGIRRDGTPIALDARIIVDERARVRQPGYPAPRFGTPFEQACAVEGVVGVELNGGVAVLTSGAGLGMATVDLVTGSGAGARCLVDLGATVFGEGDRLGAILAAVGALRPKVILVNCFLQLGSCASIAEQLLRAQPFGAPLVVRLAGNEANDARTRLRAAGIAAFEELHLACLAAAKGVPLKGPARCAC